MTRLLWWDNHVHEQIRLPRHADKLPSAYRCACPWIEFDTYVCPQARRVAL